MTLEEMEVMEHGFNIKNAIRQEGLETIRKSRKPAIL